MVRCVWCCIVCKMLVSQLLQGLPGKVYLMIGSIQPQDLCAVLPTGPLLDADGGAIVPVGGGGWGW